MPQCIISSVSQLTVANLSHLETYFEVHSSASLNCCASFKKFLAVEDLKKLLQRNRLKFVSGNTLPHGR